MEQVNRLPEWVEQLATIANEHADLGDLLCVRQNPLSRLSSAQVTRVAPEVATFVYNAAGTIALWAGAARQRGPT